jgi:hypothetical protein
MHLPFSGGALEQPCKTMDVLETVQNVYLEKLKDDIENAVKGIHI